MDNPDLISYDDFAKIKFQIATIVSAERVPKSDKLLRLLVTLGEKERQIIAGIGQAYDPVSLPGRQVAIITNLEPRSIMGLQSEGMLLAASGATGPVIITPASEVPIGSFIR